MALVVRDGFYGISWCFVMAFYSITQMRLLTDLLGGTPLPFGFFSIVVRDGFLQHWCFVVAFYSIGGSRWLFTALVVRVGFLRH